MPPSPPRGPPEAEPNDDSTAAQPHPLGEPDVGSAHMGQDVDRYRVAVPPGQDTPTLAFQGDPGAHTSR